MKVNDIFRFKTSWMLFLNSKQVNIEDECCMKAQSKVNVKLKDNWSLKHNLNVKWRVNPSYKGSWTSKQVECHMWSWWTQVPKEVKWHWMWRWMLIEVPNQGECKVEYHCTFHGKITIELNASISFKNFLKMVQKFGREI